MILRNIGQIILFIACCGFSLLIAVISGWLLFYAYSDVGRGLAVLGLAAAVLLITFPGRWIWPAYRNFWQ